jgi:hypothetical protein
MDSDKDKNIENLLDELNDNDKPQGFNHSIIIFKNL